MVSKTLVRRRAEGLIAATNQPDVLDPALLGLARFDRWVNVPRPDVNESVLPARPIIPQIPAGRCRFPASVRHQGRVRSHAPTWASGTCAC